jgi:hypothetical protein
MESEEEKQRKEAMIRRINARNARIAKRNNEAPPPKVEEDPPLEEFDGKLKIEICIHCFNYQHRLCWMLSSLVQQVGDVPDIIVNISYCENNGNPTTQEVVDFFKEKGLNIKETLLTEEQMSNRSIARNLQVKETEAHWMLFADSDMVYDPLFFDDLQKQLKGKLAQERRVMGADRVSLNIPFCIKYFEEDDTVYPCEVENVAEISSKWPVKWIMGKRIAAGNFQLANVEAIRRKGGKYSRRQNDHWRGTRSDRGFRCRMGGRVAIDTKPQYHLNHDRGGPEIQR